MLRNGALLAQEFLDLPSVVASGSGGENGMPGLALLPDCVDGGVTGDDVTVWRASTGTWFWWATGYGFGSRQWGSQAMGDIPIVK